jgi:flagellar motor protein MotB
MADKAHDDKHSEEGHKPHGGHGAHGGGGGGHEEAHEGAPEWLISFADNVALMMGFFVILLAMNMKEPTSGGIGGKDKNGQAPSNDAMLDFALEVRKGFNNPVNPNSTDPAEQELVQHLRRKQAKGSSEAPGTVGHDNDAQSLRVSDVYNIAGAVAFDDNSAVLTTTARELLAGIARKVQGSRFIVEVRGHASAAETFRDVKKGMHLSYDRAWAVAEALSDAGVPWAQVRLVQCGDADPIVPRASDRPEHRTNQRVEVVLTQEPVPPDPFSREPARPAGQPPSSGPAPEDAKPSPASDGG